MCVEVYYGRCTYFSTSLFSLKLHTLIHYYTHTPYTHRLKIHNERFIGLNLEGGKIKGRRVHLSTHVHVHLHLYASYLVVHFIHFKTLIAGSLQVLQVLDNSRPRKTFFNRKSCGSLSQRDLFELVK